MAVSILFCLASLAETAAPTTLVHDGQLRAVVRTPAGSSELESIALEDFCYYIKRCSGSAPRVLSNGETPPEGATVVTLRVADDPDSLRLTRHGDDSLIDLVQEANEKFRLPAFARGAIGPRARVAVEVGKLEDYIIAQQKR